MLLWGKEGAGMDEVIVNILTNSDARSEQQVENLLIEQVGVAAPWTD